MDLSDQSEYQTNLNVKASVYIKSKILRSTPTELL